MKLCITERPKNGSLQAVTPSGWLEAMAIEDHCRGNLMSVPARIRLRERENAT